VIVRFVDIGGIVDHHCVKCPFITSHKRCKNKQSDPAVFNERFWQFCFLGGRHLPLLKS